MVLVQFPECDVEVMRTQFLPGHELNFFVREMLGKVCSPLLLVEHCIGKKLTYFQVDRINPGCALQAKATILHSL